MNEGWWLNYRTGRVHALRWGEEHERVIRDRAVASKLGVPMSVFGEFWKYRVGVESDRRRLLCGLMTKVPLLRVRGHGTFTTFEFVALSPKKKAMAYGAIWDFAKMLPPRMLLNIQNLATKESEQVVASEFWKRVKIICDAPGTCPRPTDGGGGRRDKRLRSRPKVKGEEA